MKKLKLLPAVLTLALLFSVFLTGCESNSLDSYKQAVQKTGTITKGQMSVGFAMELGFDTGAMTEEELRQIEYYKNVEGSFNIVFDHDAMKIICRNYLNMGGLGFDSEFYQDGKEISIKLPIIGKYLRIKDLAEIEKPQEPVSGETLKSTSNLWLSILNEDDVFRGEKIILTTPDGEVKATRYIIKLQNDQAQKLAKETIEIITKDKKLKNTYNSFIEKNFKQHRVPSFDEVMKRGAEKLDSCRLENFVYEALVDIDGYIVNETVDFKLSFNGETGPGSITELRYEFETKKWDINREQHFGFPVLTPENILEQDTGGANMPFIYKDIFSEKNGSKE